MWYGNSVVRNYRTTASDGKNYNVAQSRKELELRYNELTINVYSTFKNKQIVKMI